MTTICFIMRQLESGPGRLRDRKQDLDLSEGPTLFVNLVYGLWSFRFCRILTDVGSMYGEKKPEQNVKMCTQSCCGLITCTLIIVYYDDDDDMTECTEDDWQLSWQCWAFVLFFKKKMLLGNGCRMLKKSIIILIIMIIQVVILPP